mgnify:FL=1
MKVIFLDFDGVLNSSEFIWAADERGAGHIDPDRVRRVNRIIEATGAVIVVSSAWRILYPIETLTEFLVGKGFVGRIYDVTDTMSGTNEGGFRGGQITRWLKANPVTRYVVIDDSEDAGFGHDTNFVHTHEGIEDADVEVAICILGGTP